jgi:hypothetical protein
MPENNFISAVRGYLRLGNFPLDASSVYENFEDAIAYASTNPTAYPGQLVAVVEDRTVTVYQLGFKINPNEAGFELQPLSTGGQGSFVKSVNGLTPDGDGNVDIDLAELDRILTFLQDTENFVVFSKGIQVPTASITTNTSVITRQYLDATLNDLFDGISRTLSTSFNHQGGSTTQLIPKDSVVKKVVIKIIEPFEESDITISIAGIDVFLPEDIYETQTGIFIAEPFITLPDNELKYSVDISVNSSTTGLAEIYVDFNINFTK